MYQRLAIAAALLGEPSDLMLDEPTNGLDPEGMVWMRQLLRQLAGDGRTVLVSSHLMGELALVADRVLVIGRGRLLADCALVDLPARAGLVDAVRCRCHDPRRLADALEQARLCKPRSTLVDPQTVLFYDVTTAEVAVAAAAAGLTLIELAAVTPSLEDAYLALTESATQYRGTIDSHGLAVDVR